MLGFVFGTLCVFGLVRVLRRGYGWAHSNRACDGGGRRRFGGRRVLRSLFERLDTTPGQEKAIVAALDRLRDERRVVHEEMSETRASLAQVIRGGFVDETAFEETFARHDRLLATLRVSFVEAMKTAVEALDERQRKELGAILAGRGFFGGPHLEGSGGIWA